MSDDHKSGDDHRRAPGWLEKPSTVNALVYGIWVICGLLVIAEFFYSSHPHFGIDGWFAFNAVFGFVAYCFVVFTAKGLRVFVARRSDYYADERPLTDDQRDADGARGGDHDGH